MPKLSIVRHHTNHLLERVFPALDQAILAIPSDRLDFRPTPNNMSAKEISYHIYQVAYVLTRATGKGELKPEDLMGIPFDPDAVRSGDDIVAYGQRVQAFLRITVEGLTEDHLTRTVYDALGAQKTGFQHMNVIYEETLHHRGQLMIYLRMMGVTPPSLDG